MVPGHDNLERNIGHAFCMMPDYIAATPQRTVSRFTLYTLRSGPPSCLRATIPSCSATIGAKVVTVAIQLYTIQVKILGCTGCLRGVSFLSPLLLDKVYLPVKCVQFPIRLRMFM